MLAVTLVQVVLRGRPPCTTAPRRPWASAATSATALFHQVTGFSAQEVGEFGAPSLITRITNDVQQVQMLVLMTCTLLVAAPITIVGGIILAVREDGALSLILVVRIPVAAALRRHRHRPDGARSSG